MSRQNPYLWCAAGAVLLGALGMAWADAALAGTAALVLWLVVAACVLATRADDPAARWPRARPQVPDGARRDVSTVSWTMGGRPGSVSEEAVRRLRADATRRLARHGVVLPGRLGPRTPRDADPRVAERARDLLGDQAWTLLTSPGGTMPSLADVARCVEVIERLGTVADPAPKQTPRRTGGHPS